MRRRCVWLVLLTPAAGGCAAPYRMHLAADASTRRNETAWWVARDPAGLAAPIAGLERPLSPNRTEQVLLTARGLRRFEYERGVLRAAGPPLPEHLVTDDPRCFRAAAGRFLAHLKPASAGFALPNAAIDGIDSMADVTAILETHFPTMQVGPPTHFSFRQLEAETEHFPHGIIQLLEAAEAF